MGGVHCFRKYEIFLKKTIVLGGVLPLIICLSPISSKPGGEAGRQLCDSYGSQRAGRGQVSFRQTLQSPSSLPMG